MSDAYNMSEPPHRASDYDEDKSFIGLPGFLMIIFCSFLLFVFGMFMLTRTSMNAQQNAAYIETWERGELQRLQEKYKNL